jgi:hypothetical protein
VNRSALSGRLRRAARLAALAFSLGACAQHAAPAARPRAPAARAAPRCLPAAEKQALDAFVRENRERYAGAIAKARAFLDPLEVDPMVLRTRRIKGKKKLVEALDAYYRLQQVASPEAKPAILARVKALAQVTAGDRYHDMLTLPDREFKEDATSYLRAALLLDRMGLDIKRYRDEITAVKWRLDKHLKERGPHQRRAFHMYYEHFDLEEPFDLEGALDKGFIARRADPEKLSRMDVYAVTHEIFAAYDFGDHLDVDPFTEADRVYLQTALPRLLGIWQGKRDPDLTAELISCMRYLGYVGDPAYTSGIGYLLGAQNPDGAWGDYESMRPRLGDYVKQGFYLHTAMVVIDALTLGFEDSFRRGEGPVCGAV